MKQKLLLKTMLLLCALVAGVSNAWAAKETITLNAQGYSNAQKVTSTSGTVVTLTYDKGTGSTDPAYYTTGNGVRVYAGGKMAVTAGTYTITKVVVTFGKDGSPTISMSSNGTTTSAGTSSPATWVGSATEVYFNVSTKGHARIQSVEVTYSAPKTNPVVSFDDATAYIGRTLDIRTLFSSNSDGEVTYSITAGNSYATLEGTILTGVASGDVTVKAEQEATDDYNAAETTATITVIPYVQPTVVNATFNNVFLGVEAGARITGKTTITTYDVKFIFDCTGSNWHQGDADLIRSYKDTSIEIEAPNGYVVSGVTINFGGNKQDFGVSSGTWSRSTATATWTGSAKSVVFTNTSGRADITSVTVNLSTTTPVTITTAKYATYCPTTDLDFSATGVTVYKVKVDNKVAKFTEVTDGLVKAGEGVVLYKDVATDTEINVPVTTGVAALSDNELVGVTEATTVDYSDGGNYNYILQMSGSNLVFKKATGAKLRANRAYLSTSYDVSTSGARELTISFGDDETTAIESVNRETVTNDRYYTLDGREVENPTKGIFIVNGKKVVIR